MIITFITERRQTPMGIENDRWGTQWSLVTRFPWVELYSKCIIIIPHLQIGLPLGTVENLSVKVKLPSSACRTLSYRTSWMGMWCFSTITLPSSKVIAGKMKGLFGPDWQTALAASMLPSSVAYTEFHSHHLQLPCILYNWRFAPIIWGRGRGGNVSSSL